MDVRIALRYKESRYLFGGRLVSHTIAAVLGGYAFLGVWLVSVHLQRNQERRRRVDLERRLETDILTGLVSQAVYRERLELIRRRVKRAIGEGERVNAVVFFLDLNGFKGINDFYGHEMGDLILRQFGKRMKAAFRRADDFLARRGGDEFLIVARVKGSKPEIRATIASYCDSIKENLNFSITVSDGSTINVSCSVGVETLADQSGEVKAISSLLFRADERMREAKRKRYAF